MNQDTRKNFIKWFALGTLALVFKSSTPQATRKPPVRITWYTDEPKIGESGYEQRIARILRGREV